MSYIAGCYIVTDVSKYLTCFTCSVKESKAVLFNCLTLNVKDTAILKFKVHPRTGHEGPEGE